MKKQLHIFLLLISGLLALGFGFGSNITALFSFSQTPASDPFAAGSKVVLGSFDEYGNFNAKTMEALDFIGSAWGQVSADISNPNGTLNLRNAGGNVNIQAAGGSGVTIFSGNGYEMEGGGDAPAGHIDIVSGSGWSAGNINIRSGWSASGPAYIKIAEDSGNSVTVTATGTGINNTNPTATLDVSGTVKASAFNGTFPGVNSIITVSNLNFNFAGGLLTSVTTNGGSGGGGGGNYTINGVDTSLERINFDIDSGGQIIASQGLIVDNNNDGSWSAKLYDSGWSLLSTTTLFENAGSLVIDNLSVGNLSQTRTTGDTYTSYDLAPGTYTYTGGVLIP